MLKLVGRKSMPSHKPVLAVVIHIMFVSVTLALAECARAQDWATPQSWQNLGFNAETRAFGYQANGGWSASVWGSQEMERMLPDDMSLATALGPKFAVLARHGKYGDAAYNRSFADIPLPGGRRIVAASCNEFGMGSDFYAPVEKIARKNPGVGVFGINPKYDSQLLIDRVGEGKVLLRVFKSGTDNLIDSDDVFVYGKYCPKTDQFTSIPVAGPTGREYLANKGVHIGAVPYSEVDSSSSQNISLRRGLRDSQPYQPRLALGNTKAPGFPPKIPRFCGRAGGMIALAALIWGASSTELDDSEEIFRSAAQSDDPHVRLMGYMSIIEHNGRARP
jgi:hypothetical protein